MVPKLAFVVPTRNRAKMAIAAVNALRTQAGADVVIVVSDNSPDGDEVRRLSEFCRALADPRILYIRAGGDLPQGSHWNWAVLEALARSGATHVTVHYDRKISRPGAAAALAGVAAEHPDKVVTYLQDFVSAEPPPLRAWQHPWTGKLFRIATRRTVELSAAGKAQALGQALPILSNCLVPRTVVEAVVDRFGTLCESTTADSCFAYRFCALFDDYLHLDRPLTVLYGSHRSAGIGYLKGEGGDFADYRATWRGEAWLDAAPVPGLNLGYNMLFHEYELVRRSLGDAGRLPPLDRAGCLRDLAGSLYWIPAGEARNRACTLLREQGWDGEGAVLNVERRLSRLRRFALWVRQRRALLAALTGAAPATGVSGFRFRSDEEAVRYVLKFPRRRTDDTGHVDIADPMEIAATSG